MKHLATILDTPVYYDGADIFINVDGQLTRYGYLDADITGVLAVTDTSLLIASADNTVWCLTRYGSKWLFGRPRAERVQRILDEWGAYTDTASDNQPEPVAEQTEDTSVLPIHTDTESANPDQIVSSVTERPCLRHDGRYLHDIRLVPTRSEPSQSVGRLPAPRFRTPEYAVTPPVPHSQSG